MLFSSTTNAYSELSAVASTAFNDFWPYLVLVIGIPLAFFIIEMLIGLVADSRKDREVMDRADRAMADFERLDWEGKKK
jgi:hypothetical protein